MKFPAFPIDSSKMDDLMAKARAGLSKAKPVLAKTKPVFTTAKHGVDRVKTRYRRCAKTAKKQHRRRIEKKASTKAHRKQARQAKLNRARDDAWLYEEPLADLSGPEQGKMQRRRTLLASTSFGRLKDMARRRECNVSACLGVFTPHAFKVRLLKHLHMLDRTETHKPLRDDLAALPHQVALHGQACLRRTGRRMADGLESMLLADDASCPGVLHVRHRINMLRLRPSKSAINGTVSQLQCCVTVAGAAVAVGHAYRLTDRLASGLAKSYQMIALATDREQDALKNKPKMAGELGTEEYYMSWRRRYLETGVRASSAAHRAAQHAVQLVSIVIDEALAAPGFLASSSCSSDIFLLHVRQRTAVVVADKDATSVASVHGSVVVPVKAATSVGDGETTLAASTPDGNVSPGDAATPVGDATPVDEEGAAAAAAVAPSKKTVLMSTLEEMAAALPAVEDELRTARAAMQKLPSGHLTPQYAQIIVDLDVLLGVVGPTQTECLRLAAAIQQQFYLSTEKDQASWPAFRIAALTDCMPAVPPPIVPARLLWDIIALLNKAEACLQRASAVAMTVETFRARIVKALKAKEVRTELELKQPVHRKQMGSNIPVERVADAVEDIAPAIEWVRKSTWALYNAGTWSLYNGDNLQSDKPKALLA